MSDIQKQTKKECESFLKALQRHRGQNKSVYISKPRKPQSFSKLILKNKQRGKKYYKNLVVGNAPKNQQKHQQKPSCQLRGLIVDPLKNSDQDQQQKDKFFRGF